jgi:hypothetical protein
MGIADQFCSGHRRSLDASASSILVPLKTVDRAMAPSPTHAAGGHIGMQSATVKLAGLPGIPPRPVPAVKLGGLLGLA